jgi:hypothetical protein
VILLSVLTDPIQDSHVGRGAYANHADSELGQIIFDEQQPPYRQANAADRYERANDGDAHPKRPYIFFQHDVSPFVQPARFLLNGL